jgi:hypothetical protein
MKQITLPSGEYLLIEVPEGSNWFEMDKPFTDRIVYQNKEKTQDDLTIQLPAGEYTFICKAREATEEQAIDIVQRFYSHTEMVYTDYQKQVGRIGYLSPLESLNSLLSLHGYKPETTVILKKK